MDTIEHPNTLKSHSFRSIAGILLILAGGVLFLDRYLKTGWLSLLVLPAVGLVLYVWGIRRRHIGLILPGGLVGAIGAGSMVAWGPVVRLSVPEKLSILFTPQHLIFQVGVVVLYTGIGWGIVIATAKLLNLKPVWWALVPGGIFFAIGYFLLYSSLTWVDFVFSICLGIGLPLLAWGLLARYIGLVIPGCLLSGIGPGIFLAWRAPLTGNGLTQTGVMLVCFSFGWLMITAAARHVTHGYVWWPLIPGGILAMVGIGLYIGGDPSRALGFIGNTGSIALIIFGLYLLLMRKGIHH